MPVTIADVVAAKDEAVEEIKRLRAKLDAIHDITQDNSVPCWQKIQNIEATARYQ